MSIQTKELDKMRINQIDGLIQELNYSNYDDINLYRESLEELRKTLNDVLNRRVVHLALKREWYVYANWTDETGNHVEYIGKHLPANDRQAKIWHMTHNPPHPKHFRVSDKKREKIKGNVHCEIYRDDSHNLVIEYWYNYTEFYLAREKHEEELTRLESQLSEIAQTDRLAGLAKLQRLIDNGFFVKPLQY